MSDKEKCLITDLDGVVFQRGSAVQLMGALVGAVHRGKVEKLEPPSYTGLTRPLETKKPSPAESVVIAFHGARPLLPGVSQAVQTIGKTSDIIGSTGRPNTHAWVTTTRAALQHAGIAESLTRVDFKPTGVSGAASKANTIFMAVQQYPEVTYAEDDPRTAYVLAKEFPTVSVRVVDYPTNGLLFPRSVLKKLPNVVFIRSFSELQTDR